MKKELRGAFLPREGRKPVVEVIEAEMVPILAAKTGAERLAMSFEMGEFARHLMACGVRAAHPDWDEGQVADEVARRLAGGFT
jgi:hypothetical protein